MAQNIKVEVKGSTLVMSTDLAKNFGPSKSGKSEIIATTSGNIEIAPGIFAGINIYRKAK